MLKCNACESYSNWKCISCNELLCALHKRSHNNDDREHNITKLKFKLEDPLKHQACYFITKKLDLIDQLSNHVIKSSEIITAQLSLINNSILTKFEEKRMKYINILKLLETEIIDDQLKEIEAEINTILVYDDPSLDNGVWYDQEILKDISSNSLPNRFEELIRIGCDTAKEVLNASIAQIESSNI